MTSSQELASTCLGTPCYMPPEQLMKDCYNNKTDMWALGCLLYEILSLKRAFEAKTLYELQTKINKG